MKLRTKTRNFSLSFAAVGLAALLAGCSAGKSGGTASTASPADPNQVHFATPEAAVAAVEEIVGQGNEARVEQIFGKDSMDLLQSGDEVADRENALEIKKLINERVAFLDIGENTKAAVFGNDEWPFPIPLVKDSKGWRYDTEAGREEIENRRVGANELRTLATLHAVVDAQREYHAGAGIKGAYASRVVSSKGKRDGLYWPTGKGQKESPLGALVAEAAAEGYGTDNSEPRPYHGYYYRMLTEQGANAPGGATSYVDAKGRMSKGFAMVAWPARYNNSGRMTFLVGKQGIVFQKDLGEGTEAAAQKITAFDPDGSWEPTGD
jgi:hypothetical protein